MGQGAMGQRAWCYEKSQGMGQEAVALALVSMASDYRA